MDGLGNCQLHIGGAMRARPRNQFKPPSAPVRMQLNLSGGRMAWYTRQTDRLELVEAEKSCVRVI